uniref:Uncharacterized protein n=1 Tax=Acrobeloides nanus TaxID=290746 RepID=A0A914CSX1_9BILA
MDQVIRIKMFEEEKKAATSRNMITKSTIRGLFLLPDEAIIQLSYMLNGEKIGCKNRNTPKPCFLLPDGWKNIQFLLESNKVSSRPASSMDIQGLILSNIFKG